MSINEHSSPHLNSDTTSHDRKETERKEREEHRKKEEAARESVKARKSLAWKALAAILILALGYWVYIKIAYAEKPFTSGEVHWHTKLDLSICGHPKNLPRAPAGSSHLGNILLHTHDDDIVHVEGHVLKKDEIRLGEFFDAINVPFGKDRFFDKKNGDLCDGKPGMVKMWVDDKESQEFRDLLALDGQKVKISFE